MLAREDIPELSRLLLEPGDGLGVGDLALAVGDLPGERGVLRCKRAHLGVEVAALRHLTVDGECNQAADPRDEHDGNPPQRDRTVERRTLTGTDDEVLSGAG
jgi:hypothetical protein